MEKYIDILIERTKIIKGWRAYMPKLVEAIKTLMPDARIYLFGSIVKRKAVAGSDIDVLIISKSMPKSNIERSRIKIKIEELSKLPWHHPFEIHLADEEEAKWYFKIKELKEYK